MVYLVLEQFGRLVQQIDRDQPVGKFAYHFVAAPSDRRQFTKIVEQTKRLDRRQPLTLPAQEKTLERSSGLVLNLACHVRIGMCEQCCTHDVECVAVAAVLSVKMCKQLEAFRLRLVAAPHRSQCLEVVDDILSAHATRRESESNFSQSPL